MQISFSKYFTIPVFISVLVFGLIYFYGYKLRAAKPEYYPLGFDQIQILENAQKIHSGDLVLLGPRTGPAPMFTGPLIYYIAAFFLFFTPAPFVLVPTSLAIYAVTFLVTIFLTLRYLRDVKLAWLIAALLAFSPYQIYLDRTPWNPNLTFLAGALVFFPLFYTEGKKLRLLDLILIMSGCFLGYQAHFSGLLLPLFVLLAWWKWYRKEWWLVLASGFATAASLVPTALFDYRHNYPNITGLLGFIKQRGVNYGPSLHWWEILVRDVLVTFESMGKVIAFPAPNYIVMPLGILLFTVFFFLYRKATAENRWPLIWVFSLNVILFFYKGTKPEYYFLLQLPAFFYVISKVLKPVLKTQVLTLLVIIGFGFYAYFSTTTQLQKEPSLAMQNQVDATQKVREYQKETNSLVVYDMSSTDAQGMRYLLPDLKSGSATTSVQTTHLVYPYKNDSPVSNVYGELAVWQDPRIDSQKKYLVRKQTIIVTPLDIELLESHYHQSELSVADASFVVENQAKRIARIYFVDKKEMNEAYNIFIPQLEKQLDTGKKAWQIVKVNEKVAYAQSATGTTLIAFFEDVKMSAAEQAAFLEKIQIISYAQ